eukprot:11675847-Alexandrium_andersonii.AAC.1
MLGNCGPGKRPTAIHIPGPTQDGGAQRRGVHRSSSSTVPPGREMTSQRLALAPPGDPTGPALVAASYAQPA